MAGKNVSQKLLESHLIEGEMIPGEEIGIKIDQTLTQDATGTMVMLELEAMGLDQAKTEVSAQYVDHNLLQADFKNADDHLFLYSACQRFGIWYSRPGNGVSHPVHMERFGIPGKTLLGADSHTCAAGSLGMLSMGAGGLEVAMSIAGEPFHLKMPKIMGIKLTGSLPDWVSAKDIILEVLRRHTVEGGKGKIIEYYGPGIENLTAMDRHVIANMGAELGATATVFPSDFQVKKFLKQQQREDAWVEIVADDDATYDLHDEIDLSTLEPLIACPTSPGNVVKVREVEGKKVHQTMIGSSANPGLRDFVIPALILKGKKVNPDVSLDINPSSRQILEHLTDQRHLNHLIHAGGRIHQAGCNGCIGMGQAPATGKVSLRTVPRNFPGRSGTIDDLVYLCSPETAAASAITGVITDPRDLKMEYPKYNEPESIRINTDMLTAPNKIGERAKLEKGPNIKNLPSFDALTDTLEGPVSIKMGDDVSTDEIMPAGAKVLPFRSNIPEISKFVFYQVDADYYKRAMAFQKKGHVIVAGKNYGQGSSREHAVIAPRHLGVRVVIAKDYARIHWQNLANFGILALNFINEGDYEKIDQEDTLVFDGLRSSLEKGENFTVKNQTKGETYSLKHLLSPRQVKAVLEGGIISLKKNN